MRKTIATSATAMILLFGGAGVAHATAPVAPAPTSSITTLADDNGTANSDEDHGDKTGLWGLAGLLGLIGLAGLKRRKETPATYSAAGTVPGNPNAPRV
jgi:MYXO-CTERM domain-containing protein